MLSLNLPLRRPRCRWEEIITMDLEEIMFIGKVGLIWLMYNEESLVNITMNL